MSIVVVSTGGTIASTEEEGGDATPDLTGAELVAAVPALEAVADLEVREFASVPSQQFGIDQLWDLTVLVRTLDADPSVEGVVVTHGTNAMEESAYFLDLCYDGTTPVVFTGAMRNPSMTSPDGPANLLAAARTAADERAERMGVLVAFNDRVYAARDVTKAHSMNVDTFRAPEFGPLAAVDEDRVTWRRQPVDPDPTMDPGHVPTTVVDALTDLRREDVPVFVTTRSHEGRLYRDRYGFAGSEHLFRELDCYFSDLPLAKTRVRAIVALAADRLDDAFDRPGADGG